MKRFVADTGPLLHLHEVGAWSLLPKIAVVETTPEVVAELKRFLPQSPKGALPSGVRIVQPSATARSAANAWVQAGLLHLGEAEALAHAHETHADGFLTDDAQAREMATALRLEARGSLGIVLSCAARGLINQPQANKYLYGLEYSSTLWLSTKVRLAAREALKQIYPR